MKIINVISKLTVRESDYIEPLYKLFKFFQNSGYSTMALLGLAAI